MCVDEMTDDYLAVPEGRLSSCHPQPNHQEREGSSTNNVEGRLVTATNEDASGTIVTKRCEELAITEPMLHCEVGRPMTQGRRQILEDYIRERCRNTLSAPVFSDNRSSSSPSSTFSVSSTEAIVPYDSFQQPTILAPSSTPNYNGVLNVQDLGGPFDFSPQDQYYGNTTYTESIPLESDIQNNELQSMLSLETRCTNVYPQYQVQWALDMSDIENSANYASQLYEPSSDRRVSIQTGVYQSPGTKFGYQKVVMEKVHNVQPFQFSVLFKTGGIVPVNKYCM